MPKCESPEDCDDGNECTANLCADGACEAPAVDDGTACTEGECHQGVCAQVFACTEDGIRDAIAEGGGPHFFACDGPTTVETKEEIVIDNDVILDGEGELTVDGNMSHRVFSVATRINATLQGVEVTRGEVIGIDDGGGIFNEGTLMLTNSTVSDNRAVDEGGGIYNFGTLTLTNSTVSGNVGGGSGGGINNAPNGTLTLTNSTVSGNATGDEGGGILNAGLLEITNSTVSDNTAEGEGGGIYSVANVTLRSSTVSGNTAASGGGIVNVGALAVTNSLIDGVCAGNPPTSGGGNLESPANTCGFDDSVPDLKLGPLQNNGGPTKTHALLPGSPAIDQILEADCLDAEAQLLTEDQRGESRPGGARCDVGSFEVQP
jgi:predicted outer membrane repeat protein